jgi:hypothetical protein
MLPRVAELDAFGEEVRLEGATSIVLLGMGGSSLAPEVIQRVFGPRAGWPTLAVLDTTHPDAIAEAEARLDLSHTLFVVSSKSGTTIETSALSAYFWERAGRKGGSFVAITDPGTPLEALARERGFRRVLLGEPEIGGRFSALSVFGMVPASLIGADVGGMLSGADRMASRCSGGGAGNPGARLGAVLAEGFQEGRDKLVPTAEGPLAGLGVWIEQLVAESTGKDGIGIVPVVDEPAGGRVLALPDVIPVPIEGDSPADLGAEFYRWEFGTALAGAWMGVNPFDQPDVAESKANTEGLLGELASGPPPAATGLEGLERALSEWLESVRPRDYVAVLCYMRPDAARGQWLHRVRRAVGVARGVVTTAACGPRFLHSTGQLHKGGGGGGAFLQIETEPERELPVPGAGYSFGRLHLAQALGDHRALLARGRRVLRLRVRERDLDEVARLVERASGVGTGGP